MRILPIQFWFGRSFRVTIKHLTGPALCSCSTGRIPTSGVAWALLLVLSLATSVLFCSCAPLSTKADPIVVRAEQSIAVAFATFDTFEKLDNSDRSFARTNAPAIHAFAEWLRAPVGDPPTPRGLSYIESADAVKNAYKANRSADNKASLATALATLEAAVTQTQVQLSNLHNAP